MMSGKPPQVEIHYLAHALASDVIGFAATRLHTMFNLEEKEIMDKWGKEELSYFFKTYLRFLNDAYTTQIKAINKGLSDVKCDTL